MSNFMEKYFSHLCNGRKEYTEAEVRLIIEGAIAEEREACAKVAEQFEPDEKTDYVTYASNAIRARGQA